MAAPVSFSRWLAAALAFLEGLKRILADPNHPNLCVLQHVPFAPCVSDVRSSGGIGQSLFANLEDTAAGGRLEGLDFADPSPPWAALLKIGPRNGNLLDPFRAVLDFPVQRIEVVCLT